MKKSLFTLFILFVLVPHVSLAMTPEQLVQVKHISLAKLAPDGKSIAYVKSIPREPQKQKAGDRWQELYLVNHKGVIRPLISGQNDIKRIQWNAESNQIWLLMRRAHELSYGIYMIRIDGGEALKVIGRQSNIHGFHLGSSGDNLLFWLPDMNKFAASDDDNLHLKPIFYEEQTHLNNRLYALNLKDLKAQESQLNIDGHIINAEYSPDESTLLVKRAPSYLIDDEVMKSEFLVLDTAGLVKNRFSGFGKMSKAIYSPDASRIAFIAALTPSSPDHGQLYIGDIKTGDTRLLLEDFKGMVTDIAWPRERHILFSADIGTRSILAQKKPNSVSSRFKTLAENSLILRSIDAVKSDVVIIANSPLHPNELFWYRKRQMLRISQSNPELEAIIEVEQSKHQYNGKDNLPLDGIMLSPNSASKNQPLATVIFVHGGPESHVSDGWISRYSQPAHVLANKGIRSFFPNYRGSSGRGDAFLKLGQNDYAGAEFADILAAKNWLVAQGYSDPKQIAIVGASYGGYAAAWGATRFSEHFSAAVMISGISHQVSKFGTTDIPTEMLQTHALSMPWQSWDSWLKASPIYYSDLHKTPLLMIHGVEDPRVHYSQSLEMYRHLKLRNQAPVRLLLYPEQGHTITDSLTQLDIIHHLVNWIEHFIVQNQAQLPTQMQSPYVQTESVQ